MDRPLSRLTWLALLVVDEAAEERVKGPIAPSAGLRLALAYLHSIADGPIFTLPSRRHVFDTFWQLVTGPLSGGNPRSATYTRSTMIDSCQQQIGRQIGQSANLFNSVRAARHRAAGGRAREQLARAVKQFVDDEDERKLDKRRYYWRPKPKPKQEG